MDRFACSALVALVLACGGSGGSPGARELRCADGRDDDGDMLVDCADDDCVCTSACPGGMDADSDGVTECAGDCDDMDATRYPGAPEVACLDGVDNDCDDDTDCADSDCPAPVAGTNIDLEVVATGLPNPVYLTHAGDGTGRRFVVLQNGEVRTIDAAGAVQSYLDIRARVLAGGERGLLSMAFHPRFTDNGRFFVFYTNSVGDTVVSEFTVDGDPRTALPSDSSERILLTVVQSAPNHNGGQIAFGPDGYLYIALGDGGGAGDEFGNGQTEDTLLAKVLRIDVDAAQQPYGIPSDNPFIGVGNHRPETYAWGLRNPWRFSFDRVTGELWLADVGQGAWEEIDVVESGGNYGWPETEGNHCFTPMCDLNAFDAAVSEYPHSVGVAVVGGFVYRGCAMPDLRGEYFYSDYPWVGASPLWTLSWDGTNATGGAVDVDTATLSESAQITSFGEDEAGELYVCDTATERVLRIVTR